MYIYKTKGTCSRAIEVELDGDIVKSVRFDGGCNGNTKGVAKLVEGKTVDEVYNALSGIRCGFKTTSCPDQLAQAVVAARDAQK
ncbi:MAG: TIGR03905 family TSCPD domain-containing protein [Acutalibacteraceae bacterium]